MSDLILITGATGFLGGAVAVDAIRRGMTQRLLLLVRTEEPHRGFERLIDNLLRLGASEEELSQLGRDQMLVGELNNLRQIAGDVRLDYVGQVIHCAALATFSPHPDLQTINVDGTLALAQLMYRRERLRRFVYISTAMACGKHSRRDDEGVPENIQLSTTEMDHLVPYTLSKAVGEQLLQHRFPDLPLVVLRPSIIVGHSTLGCVPSQSIFWVFQVWHRLGVLPAAMDDRIDVVPVDWCATAILDLTLKERLAHEVYHLSAGPRSSQTFRQIGRAMQGAGSIAAGTEEPSVGDATQGFEYTCISLDEVDHLLQHIRRVIPDCNPRLLVRALKLYGEFARLSYVFKNHRLLSEGIAPPPRLTDYIGICIDSTRHISISSQMEWDFK
jgi:nucleoside-diphosphate-sugar epimerase